MKPVPVGMLPRLILVSGRPGSGKSTLARRLADEDALWLPLVACDPIRVGMLDTLGVIDGDPTITAAMRRATIETFYDMIALLLRRGVSLIAELSFRRGLDEQRLLPLRDIATLVNVHCQTSTAEAQRRFIARERTRRPVKSAASFIALMEAGDFDWSPFDPLDLAVPRLLVDTTVGYSPDLAAIASFCLRNHSDTA